VAAGKAVAATTGLTAAAAGLAAVAAGLAAAGLAEQLVMQKEQNCNWRWKRQTLGYEL
jgi:hypothetical protein